MSKVIVATSFFAVISLAQWAFAMGTEEKGNRPLNALNYPHWKGIMPVINDKARVFQSWVNGNEWLFYQGGNEQLNAALEDFARVEVKNHVVVLRPGPVEHRSFDGQTSVSYSWDLHVVGGIARSKATDDINDLEWQKDPVLTVYIGGEIDLEKIKIPDGVTLRAAPGKSEEAKQNNKLSTSIEELVRKHSKATK